jgi:hypothetical protein
VGGHQRLARKKGQTIGATLLSIGVEQQIFGKDLPSGPEFLGSGLKGEQRSPAQDLSTPAALLKKTASSIVSVHGMWFAAGRIPPGLQPIVEMLNAKPSIQQADGGQNRHW